MLGMSDTLYPTQILALAASLPAFAPLESLDGAATKRSMVCGSEVSAALTLNDDGEIADLSLDVQACALGQAAASILAQNANGASQNEIVAARDALEAMLKQGAPAPRGRFADLAALESVRDYPRRHASTLLAFRAVADAMEAALEARAAKAG